MNALAILLGQMGVGQWVIIGLAVLLLFGGKKIPELMKGLGGGVKEFKNALKDEETKDSKNEEDKKD